MENVLADLFHLQTSNRKDNNIRRYKCENNRSNNNKNITTKNITATNAEVVKKMGSVLVKLCLELHNKVQI